MTASVPQPKKASILMALRAFARRFDIDLRRYSNASGANRWRRFLELYGISLVIDVGADVGHFGSELRQLGWTDRIVSFEPLSSSFQRLDQKARNDPGWECRNLALGAMDERRHFHIAGNSESSSLKEMLPTHIEVAPHSAYVGTETVDVRRLDTIASEFVLPDDRIWMKIDVQGTEKDVLDGAAETLKNVRLLQMELSVVPLYEDQLLFREMTDHVYTLGFHLVKLDELFLDPITQHLLQFDATFARA